VLFGLRDGGGFVSDNGDWALTDVVVVVVVGAVADCPRSCKYKNTKEKIII
jgi:hypothetical protein